MSAAIAYAGFEGEDEFGPCFPQRAGEQIVAEWQRCRAWLLPAMERDPFGITEHDVIGRIMEGQALFWPLSDSAIVTRLTQENVGAVIHFWLAGGDLDELRNAEPRVVEWYADYCAKVGHPAPVMAAIHGREGWQRALDGYERAVTTMVRRL